MHYSFPSGGDTLPTHSPGVANVRTVDGRIRSERLHIFHHVPIVRADVCVCVCACVCVCVCGCAGMCIVVDVKGKQVHMTPYTF